MPKLAYLFTRSLNAKDVDTLMSVIICWGHLLPGMVLDESICQQLTACLASPWLPVQRVVLSVITDILRLDTSSAPKILSGALMKAIGVLMTTSSDHQVKLDCCELVAIIAGEKGYIHAVIQSQLAECLVKILVTDERLRGKVIKVLKPLSRGIAQHVTYLVEKVDIVKHLTAQLQYFKAYDAVLREQYKFMGPAFNFELVHDTIETLVSASLAV